MVTGRLQQATSNKQHATRNDKEASHEADDEPTK